MTLVVAEREERIYRGPDGGDGTPDVTAGVRVGGATQGRAELWCGQTSTTSLGRAWETLQAVAEGRPAARHCLPLLLLPLSTNHSLPNPPSSSLTLSLS